MIKVAGRVLFPVVSLLSTTPRFVNSKNYVLPSAMNRALVQTEKRAAGIITYDAPTGVGSAPGKCLAGYAMTGSAILVDYNYVLMCAHTLDSLFSAVGPTALSSGKVWVVFNNEYTEATADTSAPVREASRPYANLRPDLESWSGADCGLDYALVKIEWQGNGYGALNHMATLPDPDTFRAGQLLNKPVLFLGQYTYEHDVPVVTFSTHVAVSKVTAIAQSHVWRDCAEASPAGYAAFDLSVARPGPSGSGIYDIVNGKARLVGVFSKGFGSSKYFLPIDQIYADSTLAVGSAKPGGTVGGLLRSIYAQRVKDGMSRV